MELVNQIIMLDLSFLQEYSMRKALSYYKKTMEAVSGTENYWPMLAELGKQDRFFLLVYLLHRMDMIDEWLYARCREVEADTDNCLDLWSRFHYKSTIITFAGVIQEVINNPEITIGILSYNNATASDFLGQIKREFESNDDLIHAYPDILWENPKRDAPKWSFDKGLLVQRKSNPKEPTISAYGLVDNQPTSKHFMLRVYDDIVTKESVTTPEMIHKVTEAWEMSLNLGAHRQGNRQWYAGTRYNASDTYDEIIKRNILKSRIYPATDDGTPDGNPVFMSREEWETTKNSTSEYILACQQLLNPMAGSQQEFKPEMVRRWEVRPLNLNVYILVDAASSKKGHACNTAMPVIGVDAHFNKYLLDGACHKMNLQERWEMLKKLRNKWVNKAGIQGVSIGYERYGLQTDKEHFEIMMKIEGKHFPIEEVSWTKDGLQAKDDRIRRLLPDHQNWRFFYPYTDVNKPTKKMIAAAERGDIHLIAKPIKRMGDNGRPYELVDWFLRNEFPFFPHSQLKDFLDAMSRVYDMDIAAPQIYNENNLFPSDFINVGKSYSNGLCLEPEVEM